MFGNITPVKAQTPPPANRVSQRKKIILFIVVAWVTCACVTWYFLSKTPEDRRSIAQIETTPRISSDASPALRPTIPVPAFKIVHEDYRNPLPFVVKPNTTDDQLASLLWKIRDSVRSHSFTDIGLRPADSQNRYNTSGMIEVFRGGKCASETYTEGSWPCGEGEHYAGFYQWGLGGFADDAGGFHKLADGSMVTIFSSRDDYTLPEALQRKLNNETRAESAEFATKGHLRQEYAADLQERMRQAGIDINVIASPDDADLEMISDIFEGSPGRVAFLSGVLPKWKIGLCKMGFATVTLKTGVLTLGNIYQIGC